MGTMMKRICLIMISFVAASAAQAETYRLVHAIGNDEKVVARDLSKAQCEAKKKELKAVAESVGTGGSVTCLPESLF